MAFPFPTGEDIPSTRVRAIRDKSGQVRFYDPDPVMVEVSPGEWPQARRGMRLTAREGISRLTFNWEEKTLQDSLGNRVGVGALLLPSTPQVIRLRNATLTFEAGGVDPLAVKIRPYEELLERVTFIREDGRLLIKNYSYGKGGKYDPSKSGGWWRRWASNALGLPEKARLPTNDLKLAMASHEFVIKRTR